MSTLQGSSNGSTNNGGSLDDSILPSSPFLSILLSKDHAFQEIKSAVMDALNNEVKSLDEDSWMFEGPRSRINLISKPGSSLAMRHGKSSSHWNGLPP